VRRGRLEVPAVAGGAYERGIGTMTRNNSEDAVSAREASAGTRTPALTDWSLRRTLMAAIGNTNSRRTLTAATQCGLATRADRCQARIAP
jgi:hypothetical protein